MSRNIEYIKNIVFGSNNLKNFHYQLSNLKLEGTHEVIINQISLDVDQPGVYFVFSNFHNAYIGFLYVHDINVYTTVQPHTKILIKQDMPPRLEFQLHKIDQVHDTIDPQAINGYISVSMDVIKLKH